MHAAKEIFVDGSKKGQPTDVLPLAMIALNLGTIEWTDPYLVRREVGAAEHDIFGLGLSPRVLREAFLKQYTYHLNEVLTEQQNGRTRFWLYYLGNTLPWNIFWRCRLQGRCLLKRSMWMILPKTVFRRIWMLS